MKIQYYGHAGIKIEDDLIILIDPWLNDNPLATIKAEEIVKADYIIATHNHFDHVNDIPLIAKNKGPKEYIILSGIAVWEPGQLDSEMVRGDWNKKLNNYTPLFDNGKEMWRRLISSQDI